MKQLQQTQLPETLCRQALLPDSIGHTRSMLQVLALTLSRQRYVTWSPSSLGSGSRKTSSRNGGATARGAACCCLCLVYSCFQASCGWQSPFSRSLPGLLLTGCGGCDSFMCLVGEYPCCMAWAAGDQWLQTCVHRVGHLGSQVTELICLSFCSGM